MRFFLLILFVGCALSGHAQFSAGQVQLGLGGSYERNSLEITQSASSSGTTRFTRTAIMPDVGVFVHRSLVVGVQVGVQRQQFTFTGENTDWNSFIKETITNKGYSIPLGPYLRAYQPLVNNLLLFADARSAFGSIRGTSTTEVNRRSVGVPNSRGTTTSEEQEWRAREFQLAIAPGLLYRFGARFGLELSLPLVTYSRLRYTQETRPNNEFSRTEKDFNFFQQLGAPQFGLRVFL